METTKRKKLPNKQPKKPGAISNRSDLRKVFIGTGIILVISFVVFSPGLKNELLSWDDYNYIRDNPAIRSLSWENILYLFHYKTFIMGNYHPLTILSYAVEYKIGGVNPLIYHLDNILLHLVNIVLIAWLAWLLTRRYLVTLITVSLFAIHPLRVESVIWAAERKDVLYTFFYLLALITYLLYIIQQKNQYRNYFLSLVLFLFSILSKGQAVVLPLTFILADYWYNRKFTLKTILEKIPFFAIAILFGVLAIVAQSSSLTSQRLLSYSIFERIIFAAYNLSAYLYKLVFPYSLSCFYPYPLRDQMAVIYLGAISTIVISTIVILRYRKNKSIVFGSLFYLFTIFIVIQLMPIGYAIIADRYTYIPYIGLFFIIGLLLDKLLTNNRKYFYFFVSLIVLQLIVFGVSSYIYAKTWKNNETLWLRAIKHNPENGLAYNNLGMHYLDNNDYLKAIEAFQSSIKYRKTYEEAYKSYQNLGKAFKETGKLKEAIACYNDGIAIAPNYRDVYFGRGLTYTDMGKFDSAIADFTTIIGRIQPKHAESFYSRAIAYNKKGMTDSAIADYSRAVKIKTDYSDAYTNRGNIYFNKENMDAAIADYNMSLKYNPGQGITLMNRSFAYFRKQDYISALKDAEAAQAIKYEVNPAYIKDLKSLIAGKKK